MTDLAQNIVNFFETENYDCSGMQLDACQSIIDGEKFIESHLIILKTKKPETRQFKLSLERLEKVQAYVLKDDMTESDPFLPLYVKPKRPGKDGQISML